MSKTLRLAFWPVAMALMLGFFGCRDKRPHSDGVALSYQAGAPVKTASPEWQIVLRAGEGEAPIGVPTAGAVCEKDIFLSDMRNRAVHRFSLMDGSHLGMIGQSADKIERMASPESLAVDCERGELYVSDHRLMFRFDVATGELKSRVPRPKSLGPAVGTALLTEDSIIIPGHFAADVAAWKHRAPSFALAGANIGFRLRRDGQGDGSPLLPIVEPQCRSMSPDICLRAAIDIDRRHDKWLACQAGATTVGIFSVDGEVLKRIDVRSPLFRHDGTTLAPGDPIPDRVRWLQRNSIIHSCGFFDDYVATTHVVYEPGEWMPGKAMTPQVYLNVHRLDGTPVLSDLRLPDRAMASDGHSLYVASPGANRATNGGSELTLYRFRVTMDDGALNQQLGS